jgi:hypothetical protein
MGDRARLGVFAVGAVFGGAVGALGAMFVAPTVGVGGSVPVELGDRVAVLEREMETVESGVGLAPGQLGSVSTAEVRHSIAKVAGAGPTRGRNGDPEALEDDPHAIELSGGLLDPTPSVGVEFVEKVRAAIAEIEKERGEAQAAEKRVKQREWYLDAVDKRLEELREPLALSEDEIQRIQVLALEKIADRQADEAEGAPQAELGEIDRAAQAGVREVLGDARYRQYRKLDIDKIARPMVAKVSSLAGVNALQRREIEGLLSEHIDRIVDKEVRIRSESLSSEERGELRRQIDEQNQEAWRRLREDILTEEQRKRVPNRLR